MLSFYIQNQKVIMKKRLFRNILTLLMTSSIFLACNEYTAQNYIDDLKKLTETTGENAASYTKEEWKKIAEEFKRINGKAAEACKNLTAEQKKEIRKLKNKLKKEVADFDSDELKKELGDMADQAGETLKGILSK